MMMSEYIYKCSAGETFDSIALDVYDDEKFAAELMSVNPEQCDKLVFDGGEELRLPLIEFLDDDEDDVDVTTDKAPWKE